MMAYKNRYISYTLSIAGILLIGILAVVYSAYSSYAGERESLSKRAATIAAAINVQDVLALSATSSDATLPEFVRVHEKLARIVKANPDVRFAYLTITRDGIVIFLVDGEDIASKDYSPPGQVYFEASPAFRESFMTGRSFIEGPYNDRWGNWVSAIDPIEGPDGRVIAVLGVDVDAAHYIGAVFWNSLMPILITLLLGGIALSYKRLADKEQENMHMRSEFIAVASHELRSPITGIKWVLERIMETGKNLTGQQNEMLNSALHTCEKLLFTVNDILETTALERGKLALGEKVETNIYVLVRDAFDNLKLFAKERNVDVSFEGQWQTMGDEIRSDKGRMRMALTNVLSNAIKYSPEQSKVVVLLKQEPEGLEIEIIDQGIGIPDGDRGKIFRGFFRSENAKRHTSAGTGLGLSYAKAIIEMHGGRIWFESKLGKGTVFHVLLPRA